MLYDLVIVGQGITGTILYDFAKTKFKNILIISNKNFSSSTEVAAGIYNPISIKRCTLSWGIEKILPYSLSYYKKLQQRLDQKIIFPIEILKLFLSKEDKSNWEIKKSNTSVGLYIKEIKNKINYNFLNKNLGGAIISSSGHVNINLITNVFFKQMSKNKIFWNEKFNHSLLKIYQNHIKYKDIKSKRIVFCEGDRGAENPFFKNCRFSLCKGEVLLCQTNKNLNLKHILSKEVFIVPKEKNIIQIGATYERDYFSREITCSAADFLIKKTKKIIDCDLEILQQKAAIRPTVIDRRPIIGTHVKYENMHIFNGFGSKSVVLAPYFANLFIDKLVYGKPCITEVNPYRFKQKLTF